MAIQDVSQQALTELISLQGKVAVVTGAGRGIGRAVAARLAEAGAFVVAADKNADDLQETLTQIQARGGRGAAHPMDVRVRAEVEAAAEQTAQQHGGLHIWVNDAGLLPMKAALEVTEAEWTDTYQTNVAGTFFGAVAAARQMLEQGGVIVNFASSLAFHSVPNQPHYVSSKWAVRGMTAALASEWGKYNIRVLAMAPGLTRTPGTEHNQEALGEIAGGDPFEVTSERYPLGRTGVPDDLARMVLVAVSDLAIFMTGDTILVDGGEVVL